MLPSIVTGKSMQDFLKKKWIQEVIEDKLWIYWFR